MPQIKYGNECFEYEIVKKKKKNIGIRVTPEGEVRVTVPSYVEDSYIHEVMYQKAAWILSKLKFASEKNNNIIDRKYVSGESFLYLGKEYKLEIIESNRDQGKIRFNGEVIESFVNPDWIEEERKDVVKAMLVLWYKHEAFKKFKERTKIYADILKLYPNDIKIKEQRSIWGSCSGKNNINYNWRLIMAPLPVLDYIVVHELCHLKHRDHSKNFWGLVGQIMPDYIGKKQWLKENGNSLRV